MKLGSAWKVIGEMNTTCHLQNIEVHNYILALSISY